LKSRGIWTVTDTDGRFLDALQAGGRGLDSPQLHSAGLVEFVGFSSRNRPGFCWYCIVPLPAGKSTLGGSHPSVAEAAVVGFSNNNYGDDGKSLPPRCRDGCGREEIGCLPRSPGKRC